MCSTVRWQKGPWIWKIRQLKFLLQLQNLSRGTGAEESAQGYAAGRIQHSPVQKLEMAVCAHDLSAGVEDGGSVRDCLKGASE